MSARRANIAATIIMGGLLITMGYLDIIGTTKAPRPAGSPFVHLLAGGVHVIVGTSVIVIASKASAICILAWTTMLLLISTYDLAASGHRALCGCLGRDIGLTQTDRLALALVLVGGSLALLLGRIRVSISLASESGSCDDLETCDG